MGDAEINEELLEPFFEDNEIDVSKFICGLLDKGLQPLSDPRFKNIINKLVLLNLLYLGAYC